MKILFTGGRWREECECYGDFHAIEELIAAGYIILNVGG